MFLKVIQFVVAGLIVFFVFLLLGLSLSSNTSDEIPIPVHFKLFDEVLVIYSTDRDKLNHGYSYRIYTDGSIKAIWFNHGKILKTYERTPISVKQDSTSLPVLEDEQERSTSEPYSQSTEEKHRNSDTEQSPQEP